jgi:hypothetical protein
MIAIYASRPVGVSRRLAAPGPYGSARTVSGATGQRLSPPCGVNQPYGYSLGYSSAPRPKRSTLCAKL